MKKLLSVLVFGCLFALQACAVEEWQEGEHYVVLSRDVTSTPQITEFFSFWCPHCFSFEPLVKQMKEKAGSGVSFQKVHVNFMQFTGPDVQNIATRGMLIARSLKREEELNQAVFRYIHVERKALTTLDDIKNIFVANGVNADEFDKLALSFGVNSQLMKNNGVIDNYRSYLNGVPNFVVNGKYQARFTRDMTPDDMVDLVVWLTKLK